jgi:UDP-perosamine 4-acetyltransferase
VRLLVHGAGGHAKVVIDAARRAGYEIAGVVGRPEVDEAELLGIPVSHSAADIEADGFIVAVGDNATRAQLFDTYLSEGLSPASVVEPSAILAESVEVGAGSFVAAGVVVNIDAHIGQNAILNTGCTVDHDCVIGDHTLIGPTSSLCGGVQVGTGVLLGAGVSVTPTVTIGEWCVVGAGAAVVEDLPARSTCVGVPAHPIARAEE